MTKSWQRLLREDKMKIIITHDNINIGIIKDYSNANLGLVGQFIAELEILKIELLDVYNNLKEAID